MQSRKGGELAQASVREAGLKLQDLREAIRDEYRAVALEPDRGFHFHTGRPLAQMLEYRDEWLKGVPEETIASFAGTGNPFLLGEVEPGERVVDIGCGAGMDSLIAARMAGPRGRVIGIDMSQDMLAKARRARAETGLQQVEFRYGYGEELPVPDGWADVVISNGVLNLMPDKSAGLEEMNRVLKPEGQIQIADIVVEKGVPVSAKRDIDLWTGWIAGALLEAELEATVVAAGLVDFEVTERKDIYRDAPQQSSAESYGTYGITFRARKPADEAELQAALQRVSGQVPEWDEFLEV